LQEIDSGAKITPKKRERVIMSDQGDEEYIDEEMDEDDDDISADIEHNFDDENNEEELMQRLEEIGDSGRSKHKTFEGIPK
jgi:hypothetical protein